MNSERKLGKTLLVVLIGLFALSLAGSATAQTWIPLRTSGSPPNHRWGNYAINYDADNNRLIVYLSSNPAVPPSFSAEAWVLTNANGLGGTPAWTKLQTTGPAPFAHGDASAVYDATTNKLIVYGGCYANCSPALEEVFVLTNANGLGGPPVWSRSVTNPPQARAGHSAVFDSTNNRMIAFGGGLALFGTDQNDTRILSNANESPANWSTLATSGGPPGPREGHSAIYDEINNCMIVFGGHNAVSGGPPYDIRPYNDVWVLSNANGLGGMPTWVQLRPLGNPPSTRSYHSAVYDSGNNQMIIFGGLFFIDPTRSDYIGLGDVWVLSNANGLDADPPTWTQIGQFGTPPGANYSHGAAFDAINQRMIVFGGADRAFRTHTLVWVLDLSSQ